ncbi:MAG: beta-lactamase family protein [Actinobacteria bacterium]|nr:beta-lactamase family protein [Actinomycetota bacterium]
MGACHRTSPATRRAVALAIAVALVGLTACLPDTSVIDARLEQAVAPAAPPATGCVETCGISLLVTSRQADGADVVEYDRDVGNALGNENYYVASASKWLAGAVVMSVVDDGLLSLGSTVGEWFPAYAGTTKGSITLAQLMSHTSGMAWTTNGCVGNQSTTLAACADTILAADLAAAPGTQFAYGGNSIQVAARMAELATGQSWVALSQARLIGPLGLTKTWWTGANPHVAGGAASTQADYDRFLAVIQSGGTRFGVHLLSPAAVAAMETDRVGSLAVAYSPIPSVPGYGIGVWLAPQPGGPIVSSPGAFGVFPLIDRSRCYRAVLFQNSSFAKAASQMAVIEPELERQLHCPG